MSEVVQQQATGYSHQFQPTILREYDIRGIVGKNVTDNDAYAVGRGFGTIVARDGGKKVVIGYDGRESSPFFAQAAAKGLSDCGLDVVMIGLGPSPMTYFAVYHLEADAGLMITGSHNPPDYNGFKMTRRKGAVFGDQIQLLGRLVASGDVETGTGTIGHADIEDAYVARMLADYTAGAKPLKIVWDNGNGAAGNVLRKLVQKLPGEHIVLFGDVDGTFPNHHPDPTVAKNLVDLQNEIATHKADLGIGFDGDADRIGIVAEDGEIIWCDQLIAVYAAEILSRHPGAPIIADVKSSQILFDEIARLGGKPIMWKTGHSLIKSKMAEEHAPVSGELSGHIFFKDGFYGHDDALYCAIRLLSILNKSGKSIKELTAHLPKVVNTPEIRFQVDEDKKFKVITDVQARLGKQQGMEVNTIDGARVKTADGWWLLRASNTQDVLVARAESTSAEGLERLKALLREQLSLSGITPPNELM